MLDLVPESLRVARGRLRQNSEKMAIEILKGTQIMVPRTEQELHHRTDPFEGKTNEELDYFTCTGDWPEGKPLN